MKVAALIAAAGSGTRLGLGPKALLDLSGRSLLARSVAGLRSFVDDIVVALPEDLALPAALEVQRVSGGPTRQHTVARMLSATDAELVLVHDAARPFLPPDVAQRAKDAARSGAATAALPVADTLVQQHSPEQTWGRLTPRQGLWAVQTPQGFHRTLLQDAHRHAERDGVVATDDAGLVARLGVPVQLVLGDARLLKVTTPGDWQLASALAALWDAAEQAQ